MIPSFFVALEALPLLPSGKIDRRALPAPSSSRPLLSAPVVMPRTSVEVELAKIWENVLNVEQVGVSTIISWSWVAIRFWLHRFFPGF